MKRANRLGRSRDLETLLRRGRRFASALFQIGVLRNRLGYSRFAFVVPASVDKRAVARNRIRRRMREYVRIRHLTRSPAFDVVIFCKKEAASAPRNIFYDSLDEILTRIWQG